MNKMQVALGCLVIALSAAMAVRATAADVEGGKDHPLVGRYARSSIVFYKTSDFDQAALLQAAHDYASLLERNAMDDRSGAEWLKLEGRVTEIRYEIPEGRSSLEVISNYEVALKSKGFAVAFSCSDKACLTGAVQDPYLLGQQIDTGNGLSTAYFDHARYLLAKLDRPQGAVYVSVIVGEDKQQVIAFAKVVETKAMEIDKIVFINAQEMGTAIDTGGRVDVYGILFDFDKDTLRSESKPTLDEIAKLLGSRPDLRLNFVGHTDNKGTADYNMNLSTRRAANVVAALTQNYGIAAERLKSEGAGLSKPVAENDTEEGRAKNRRVELIAQ